MGENVPILKKYDYSFSFRVTLGSKQHPDIPFSVHYVYLDDGLLINVPINPDNHEKTILEKTEYKALRVDKAHGLMSWDEKEHMWTPLIDKFQEAYATFQADKILLGAENANN